MKYRALVAIIAAFLFATPRGQADLFDTTDDNFFPPVKMTTDPAPVVNDSGRSQKDLVDIRVQTLIGQMQRVSSWLEQYVQANHRFPDPGDEFNDALSQLNQLVPNNPYAPSLITTSPGPDNDLSVMQTYPVGDASLDRSPHRIHLVFDPSLSETQAELYVSAPPDDWRAAPGTITAVCNNQNLYIVWGAGRDGFPVRNEFNGKVELLFGRFPMLNFQ
jgi:hypothetical protein